MHPGLIKTSTHNQISKICYILWLLGKIVNQLGGNIKITQNLVNRLNISNKNKYYIPHLNLDKKDDDYTDVDDTDIDCGNNNGFVYSDKKNVTNS